MDLAKEKPQKHQQQKSEQTRKAVIEAAFRLFGQKGVEAVGVREIAKEAGVTTGTFYYYFSTKYEVLDAFYDRNDAAFGELLRAQQQEADAPASILRFFTDVLAPRVLEDGKEFTRYRMFQMRRSSEEDSALHSELNTLVELAQSRGQFGTEWCAQEITRFLMYVFRGILYQWCIQSGAPDIREELQKNMKKSLAAFYS